MDDLQLHMEIAQRNHDEATRIHQEFMQQAIRHAQQNMNSSAEPDEEMDRLEREFNAWMTYIKNKKL